MTEAALSAQLGFAPEDRLLIVNCDDVGSSHSANVAAFRAMTYGIATSASLMVPCPWASEAASMFAGLPMGVHLTLTSEHAGYRWRSLTVGGSLSDPQGFLSATAAAALARIDADELRAECRTQLDTALSWGVDVTHIDVHMDVLHASEALFAIYLDLAEQLRVPARLPSRPDFPARALAQARGILSADHLIYAWPRRTRDVLLEAVPALPSGVTELFAHPVDDGEELRGYDHQHADIRVHDAVALLDPDMAGLLDRCGVKRISFREIREVQRAAKITSRKG